MHKLIHMCKTNKAVSLYLKISSFIMTLLASTFGRHTHNKVRKTKNWAEGAGYLQCVVSDDSAHLTSANMAFSGYIVISQAFVKGSIYYPRAHILGADFQTPHNFL